MSTMPFDSKITRSNPNDPLSILEPPLNFPSDSLVSLKPDQRIINPGNSDQAQLDNPTRSALESFIDSFFQEKNIRWMLIIGAAIVFGSSLMLVAKQWSHWNAAIQFIIVLGYTGIIYAFGELSTKRLGLHATGRVLQSLTLLLLPVCFLSLSWFASRFSIERVGVTAQIIGLIIPAAGLAWFAVTRTMDYWLRKRQTTFVTSYLVLCFAGALPVTNDPMMAAGLSAIFWFVMTIGTIKVNRHVFWLVEEHHSPRVFGFLPICLLGSMFLLLIATKTFFAIPTEWFGFGCVALAGTILLTARSIANVFRQRTGDLVFPLPWNIAVPIVVGLVLVTTGVVLSFHGFSYVETTTIAVVPTTLCAAILMFGLASETRRQTFVWAGLALAVIAYQSTPTLIADLVQQLKSGAAHSIGEEKLPIAFYGLTYLPFILAASVAYKYFSDRKKSFVANPLSTFITIISLLLYGLAFAHLKAIWIISLVNICLFGFLAYLFQDRRYAIVSIVGLIVVASTLIPFVNSFGGHAIPIEYAVVSLSLLASTFLATSVPDRLINCIPINRTLPNPVATKNARTLGTRIGLEDWMMDRLTKIFGFTIIGFLALVALIINTSQIGRVWTLPQSLAYGTILISVGIATLQARHYLLGLAFWMLILARVAAWLIPESYFYLELLSFFTFASCSLTLLFPTLAKWLSPSRCVFETLRISRKQIGLDSASLNLSLPETKSNGNRAYVVFLVPLHDLCVLMAATVTIGFHLPNVCYSQIFAASLLTPFATLFAVAWVIWIAFALRSQSASMALVALLPLSSTGLLHTVAPGVIANSIWPLAWLVIACGMQFYCQRQAALGKPKQDLLPFQWCSLLLPAVVVSRGLFAAVTEAHSWSQGLDSLTILACAGIYFHHGLINHKRRFVVLAGAIVNATLAVTWFRLNLYDFQLYLVPIGLSVLSLVELLKKEIPKSAHDPIRYVGALTILVSPVFEILGGSWLHLFSLLVLSVLVILLAIGLRIRALVYTGSAFLMADLIAMPIRASIDHPTFLWVGGLAVGLSVISLAAICERHRETLLARIRLLSSELAAWN